MKIQHLIWDSNFFNLKVGKYIIYDNSFFDITAFKNIAKKDNYDLIYIHKYNSLLNQNTVNSLNLDLIDIIVDMSKEFSSQLISNKPYQLKNELTEKELYESYIIAEQISVVSRFHREPMIGSSLTKKLYRKWIDNSLDKSYGDGLLIENINNSIAGIHVIKTDVENKIGYCSLIGVRSDFKQKGVGRKLWNQAFQYWADQNIINKVLVPFSLQNNESLSFHLKMGFNNVENINYVYHYRKM